MNAFVDSLLAEPHNTFDTTQIDNGNSASFSGCALGCEEHPKLSHFTASELTVRGNGSVTGYGVLILDGVLRVQGTLDFYGLVVLGGPLVVEEDASLGITGNVTVYGSVWTTGLDLVVGGSALLIYGSQALSFAEQIAGTVCETPACGDGIRTYDEECDDGNVAGGTAAPPPARSSPTARPATGTPAPTTPASRAHVSRRRSSAAHAEPARPAWAASRRRRATAVSPSGPTRRASRCATTRSTPTTSSPGACERGR